MPMTNRPTDSPQAPQAIAHFTDEEIAELVELGKVLKTIHTRLAAEGKMPDTNNK